MVLVVMLPEGFCRARTEAGLEHDGRQRLSFIPGKKLGKGNGAPVNYHGKPELIGLQHVLLLFRGFELKELDKHATSLLPLSY